MLKTLPPDMARRGLDRVGLIGPFGFRQRCDAWSRRDACLSLPERTSRRCTIKPQDDETYCNRTSTVVFVHTYLGARTVTSVHLEA